MILAILIPSIVAGCRSLNIGTDINVYGKLMFYTASNLSIGDFFSIFGFSDILFSLFTLLVGKLFKNIHIFLFLLQLLNCALVYKTCDIFKKDIPVWLSYLIFLSTLYFRQLNLLRQGIAISLSLLATAYLLKGKNKNFWICFILAVLFHVSSIAVLLVYFIKILCDKKTERKVPIVIIYCVLLISLVFFIPILKLITESGILPSKYTYSYFIRYLNINKELDNLGTFFKLFWCLVTIFVASNKNFKNKIKHFDFFLHIACIDLILWMLNIHIQHIDRLSFYFGFTYMFLYIPQLHKLFKDDIINQIFIYAMIILLFVFYWYVRFILQNAGAVFPYTHF